MDVFTWRRVKGDLSGNPCDTQIEPAHARAIGRKATCLARLGAFDAAVACLEEQRDGGARLPDLDDRIADVSKQRAAYDKVCRRTLTMDLCQVPRDGRRGQVCTGRRLPGKELPCIHA